MPVTKFDPLLFKKSRASLLVVTLLLSLVLICNFVRRSDAFPGSSASFVSRPTEEAPQKDSASRDSVKDLQHSSALAELQTFKYLGNSDKIAKLKAEAKKLADCEHFFSNRKRAEILLNQPVDSYSYSQQKALDKDLAEISKNLPGVEEARTCDGMDAETSNGAIYPLLLEAADLGDSDAASCYVESRFGLSDEQLAPLQLTDYRRNAMKLMTAGLNNGDWRFVELMWLAAEHGGVNHRGRDSHSWFRRLIPPDAEFAYEYLKLLSLGATGEVAATLNQSLAAGMTKFSPEDLDRMDKWAHEQFAYYFADSPTFDALPQTCTM